MKGVILSDQLDWFIFPPIGDCERIGNTTQFIKIICIKINLNTCYILSLEHYCRKNTVNDSICNYVKRMRAVFCQIVKKCNESIDFS